jgi:Mrp family chromosome partitioning ATPase
LSEYTIAKINSVSLIEKAAGRLTASERPLESFSKRPSDEHAERPLARFKRPSEARAAKPAATSGEREVARLDFQRLSAAGFITRDNAQTRTSEEFRLIKRSILRTYKEANDPNSNIIMVTSALSAKGKTFTAINLAMSIAFERDFRVLLVDADLRKADILSHLGIKPGRAVSTPVKF